MGRMSLAQAKAHFAEAVKKAEAGERVLITRYGTPVVALVPLVDVEQLKRLRGASAQGLVALAGGWQGSDELVLRIGEVQGARTRSRRVPRVR